MMESATSTRLRGFADERSVGLVERTGFLRMDPYTAGAAIALIVTSVIVLALTTKGDVAGNPYFYVIRQSIYAVVGVALMLALARIDYSRYRAASVGIYTALLATVDQGLAHALQVDLTDRPPIAMKHPGDAAHDRVYRPFAARTWS